MSAYYNEIDPKAAAWLRELIRAGLIAPGEVDERSIADVHPNDLVGYRQCHFFAGIGVWSYALRLAGCPDDEEVWTGSCPCQPFSAAGKGAGFADERHLWPAWQWLIRQRRPRRIYGEQVASPDGLAWLDLVQADLEAEDYSGWHVDMCAAGLGSPHIRQRLWFVADSNGRDASAEGLQRSGEHGQRAQDGIAGVVGDDQGRGCGERWHEAQPRRGGHPDGAVEPCVVGHNKGDNGRSQFQAGGAGSGRRGSSGTGAACVVGDGEREGLEGHGWNGDYPRGRSFPFRSASETGAVSGFWNNAWWVYCRDEKLRPVEPSSFPLVNGAPARVGRLRGYGNAIVAEVAAAFIASHRQAVCVR